MTTDTKTTNSNTNDYLSRRHRAIISLGDRLSFAGLTVENRLALAPMAGTTDVVFRRLCREQGAAITITELVSARGIMMNGVESSYRYLEIGQDESPVAIQLFGSQPVEFQESIPRVLEHPLLGRCDLIDLNMGCPVPKVVRTGAGSALMRDLPRAVSIVETAVRAASLYGKSVTVKIRAGWDRQHLNAVDFARALYEAGAAAIAVHARTRDQFYGGRADVSIIQSVVDALPDDFIVYGNGDVCDRQSAEAMLAETGCAGVMIGRAARGNPWIFCRILSGECELSFDDWLSVIDRHIRGQVARFPEDIAIRRLRGSIAHYIHGVRGAAALRAKLMRATTRSDVMALLEVLRPDSPSESEQKPFFVQEHSEFFEQNHN